MALVTCPLRKSILNEDGAVLVTGGPGSGKTTIALAKAKLLVERGLSPGQSVLFLSFSRAAVARVIEASKTHLPAHMRGDLSIQTFHSFFWRIVRAYGYLLGAPRSLRLLLPHDEAAMRHEFESTGGDWSAERERLFREAGRVAFDLFAPKAHELLSRSTRLRALFSSCHPLIVVDEAQDTAEDQWECVRLLSVSTQVVCLADLDQQIYDFRPGVSSERVTQIMAALQPLRVDLAGENHRSPGSEIAAFANDVLLNKPRGAPYRGVSLMNYRASRDLRDRAIRQATGIVIQRAKEAAHGNIDSIAIMATWGRGINVISRALTGDGTNLIPHRVVIDEAPVLLASRTVAFMLEPRRPGTEEMLDLADGLGLAANVFQARGGATNLATAQQLGRGAAGCRAGTVPRANGVAAKLLAALRELRVHEFTGDPPRDWLDARSALRNSGAGPLRTIAEDAEQLAAFQRGRRIAAALADLWQAHGEYRDARGAFDAAISEDQLSSGGDDLRGINVMTIHRSKGKEFDAVIIFDDPNISPLQCNREGPPHPRCRRLARVGITRARHHVLMLCNLFAPPPLLDGHKLQRASHPGPNLRTSPHPNPPGSPT